MFMTRGKIVIIAVAAGIVAGLAGMVAFSGMEAETIEGNVTVDIEGVRMKSIDEATNTMIVEVDFALFNNSEKTLTISQMNYELFADEESLGQGFISLADIPLVGRPQLFRQTSTTLTSDFQLRYADDVKYVWDSLANEVTGITWKAVGTAEIETAFSIIPIPFEAST